MHFKQVIYISYMQIMHIKIIHPSQIPIFLINIKYKKYKYFFLHENRI